MCVHVRAVHVSIYVSVCVCVRACVQVCVCVCVRALCAVILENAGGAERKACDPNISRPRVCSTFESHMRTIVSVCECFPN